MISTPPSIKQNPRRASLSDRHSTHSTCCKIHLPSARPSNPSIAPPRRPRVPLPLNLIHIWIFLDNAIRAIIGRLCSRSIRLICQVIHVSTLLPASTGKLPRAHIRCRASSGFALVIVDLAPPADRSGMVAERVSCCAILRVQ